METADDKKDAVTTTASTPAERKQEIKVPQDLSKVSDAKARELVENGLVEDRDLPGKYYRRVSDKFLARIPDYTFNAYSDQLKGEWVEVKSEATE